MQQREPIPFVAKYPHDPSAEIRVALALWAVHVRLSKISQVMHEECDPQTRVKWEPEKFPPGDRENQRVNQEAMHAEQNRFCAHLHR